MGKLEFSQELDSLSCLYCHFDGRLHKQVFIQNVAIVIHCIDPSDCFKGKMFKECHRQYIESVIGLVVPSRMVYSYHSGICRRRSHHKGAYTSLTRVCLARSSGTLRTQERYVMCALALSCHMFLTYVMKILSF